MTKETSFTTALRGDLERTDRDTEGRRDALGSRSGKWATPPPECLSLIFEAGLECAFPEGDFIEGTTDDDDLCQYISAVTQTCRWWRQVALETPRLWNVLILNKSTPLKKLETWLERSKATPLSINLQEGEEVSAHIATRLVPLLLKHINRWGRFVFVSMPPWGLSNFLKALEGEGAPLPEELALLQGGPEHMPIWETSPVQAVRLFDGKDSVPKLVNIKFCRLPFDWNDSPFRNLQALCLAWMQYGNKLTVEQLINLLHESPQLIRLALFEGVVRPDELAATFSESERTRQPISLPSLTALAVADYTAPEILNLTLRLIHPPNLESLRLADLNVTDDGLDIGFRRSLKPWEAVSSPRLSV